MESKLTILSKKQEALLPAVREEYLQRVFTYRPLNELQLQDSIGKIYGLLDKPKPMTIVVGSPYAAQVAYQVIKQLIDKIQTVDFKARISETKVKVDRQVTEQVGNQVWDQVGDQVRSQVWGQVSSQVWNQVRNQVGDQVWDQVRDQVWNQVWDQVRDQVSSQVWDQVSSQVWDQASNQVWNQVRDQVSSQVRDQVRNQVWDQVRDQVRSQVWDQVSNEVRDQVSSQVWDQVRDQVRGQVSRQVADQVRDQVVSQVSNEVWNQVRDQVSSQVWDQVRDQVWNQVASQASNEVWEQVGEQVRDEVRDQVSRQVSFQIVNQIRKHVIDQVMDEIKDKVKVEKLEFVSSPIDSGDSGWVAFYDTMQRLGVSMDSRIEIIKSLVQANPSWIIWLEGIAIVSKPPIVIHRDTNNRLHNPDGLAIEYEDGWGIYAWHGTRMQQSDIVNKSSITRERILGEKNAEIRRCLREIIGSTTFASMLDLVELDVDTAHGETVRLLQTREKDDLIDDHIKFVHVVCPSTAREYFLCVPPHIKNAWEAVAWTFDMNPELYDPIEHT